MGSVCFDLTYKTYKQTKNNKNKRSKKEEKTKDNRITGKQRHRTAEACKLQHNYDLIEKYENVIYEC